MQVKEIKDILSLTGLPVAYFQFPLKQSPEPPFLIYWFPDDENFFADNKNYGADIKNLRIELYTNEKNFPLEYQVENTLREYDIPYQREESYINSEKMYMVVYNTSLYITDTDQ